MSASAGWLRIDPHSGALPAGAKKSRMATGDAVYEHGMVIVPRHETAHKLTGSGFADFSASQKPFPPTSARLPAATRAPTCHGTVSTSTPTWTGRFALDNRQAGLASTDAPRHMEKHMLNPQKGPLQGEDMRYNHT